MRTLVVLALLGSAFASPFLQDTPEVVAERQRFIQLFNAQAAAAAAAPDDDVHGAPRHQQAPARAQWTPPPQPQASQWSSQPSQQWSAQPSNQWNAPQASSHQSIPKHHNAIPSATQKWTGPVAATVPAGVDGRITPVSDTAEVAALRSAFLNTYNAALSGRPAAPAPQQTWSAAPQQSWAPAPQPTRSAAPQQTWSAAPQQSWAPAPQSQGSWTGEVADVGAATAAFAQAYSAAVARRS